MNKNAYIITMSVRSISDARSATLGYDGAARLVTY